MTDMMEDPKVKPYSTNARVSFFVDAVCILAVSVSRYLDGDVIRYPQRWMFLIG